MNRIAVIITCHNRCSKTLACLEALFRNYLPARYSLEVFLVDDGSTDGTEQAVRECYPQVNLIRGDGGLYWNGGMRVAFAAAMERDFNYYLWLNDDTILYPHAISTLLKTERVVTSEQKRPAVIVGSTQDEPGGKATYGGQVRVSKWHPIKYQRVTPKGAAIPCDTMNGNCVLIPRPVTQVVRNLDEAFIHTIGDIDYGLRSKMAGFQVVVMPGYAGLCGRNAVKNTYADTSLNVRERLNRLNGKKGLPLHAWYIFTKRHCGVFWMIFWLWPYLKVILSQACLSKNTRG
jgi:GT2 family glycosyltransferase